MSCSSGQFAIIKIIRTCMHQSVRRHQQTGAPHGNAGFALTLAVASAMLMWFCARAFPRAPDYAQLQFSVQGSRHVQAYVVRAP